MCVQSGCSHETLLQYMQYVGGIIIQENESASNGYKPKWYADRFRSVVYVAS